MLSVSSRNNVLTASRLVEVCALVVGRSYAAVVMVAISKALPEADDGFVAHSFARLCLVDRYLRALFDIGASIDVIYGHKAEWRFVAGRFRCRELEDMEETKNYERPEVFWSESEPQLVYMRTSDLVSLIPGSVLGGVGEWWTGGRSPQRTDTASVHVMKPTASPEWHPFRPASHSFGNTLVLNATNLYPRVSH
jgi:hypothetical protein